MVAGQQHWRRRTCGLLGLLHAGYVVLVVWFVVWGVTEMARHAEAGDAGTQLTMWLVFSVLVTPLLIGLLVVSPLLVWLIVLSVGLWRGRRWARVGGILTFGLAGVVLVTTAVSGGVDWGSQLFFGLLMPAPSLVGLALLLTGATSFDAGSNNAVGAQSATT